MHPRRVLPHRQSDLGCVGSLVGSGWYKRGKVQTFFFLFECVLSLDIFPDRCMERRARCRIRGSVVLIFTHQRDMGSAQHPVELGRM